MAPAVVDLLAELDVVINEDVPADEPIVKGNPDNDCGAVDDDTSVSADEPAETGNKEVQQKIYEIQVILKSVGIPPLHYSLNYIIYVNMFTFNLKVGWIF